MTRVMPTECPHGRIIDWGDFGPPDGSAPIVEHCEWCNAEERDEAYVWVSPGRQAGAPCVNGTRIPTETVASYCWQGAMDEMLGDFELTRPQILVACWFEWTIAKRLPKRDVRRVWAEGAHQAMWSSDYDAVIDPPDRDDA